MAGLCDGGRISREAMEPWLARSPAVGFHEERVFRFGDVNLKGVHCCFFSP
jgi:hypothetical protein